MYSRKGHNAPYCILAKPSQLLPLPLMNMPPTVHHLPTAATPRCCPVFDTASLGTKSRQRCVLRPSQISKIDLGRCAQAPGRKPLTVSLRSVVSLCVLVFPCPGAHRQHGEPLPCVYHRLRSVDLSTSDRTNQITWADVPTNIYSRAHNGWVYI